MSTSEIIFKIVVTLLALAAGYAVGRYTHRITADRPREQRLWIIGLAVTGVIVVVALILTIYQARATSNRQQAEAACAAVFDGETAEAINTLNAAVAAQNRHLLELAEQGLARRTVADADGALRRFRDALAEAPPAPEPLRAPHCDRAR